MNENFIRIYNDVLPDKLVKQLIQLAEQSVIWSPRSQGQRKDNQIDLGAFWPKETQDINNNLLEKAFSPYISDFPYLQDQGTDWCSGSIYLQKTEPLEGYHIFHCENSNWAYRHRVLAWMIYLNNVSDGGETYFPTQKRKLKPKEGDHYIWPAYFTHPHKGLVSNTQVKYIATGWVYLIPALP